MISLVAKYQPGKPDLYRDIQEAGYKYAELAKIVNGINDLDKELSAEQQRVVNPGASFFIEGGVNSSNVKISGVQYASVSPSSSLFPLIGGGLNMYLNKNVQRLAFRCEMYFTGNSANFNFSYNPDPGESPLTYTENMSYKTYRVALLPQLLYNIYNGQQFKFFVAAGFNMQLCTYSDKQYDITTHYANGNPANDETEPGLFPQTLSLIFNATGKIGVVINNNVELYAGYTPSTDMIEDNFNNAYRMDLTQYNFGVSYLFGHK